jgi:hypothetical protein
MILSSTITFNNFWKIVLLGILFFLFQIPALAQTTTIKSRVLDKTTKEPLLGANVIIDGTSLGAATDLDGRFIIRSVPLGKQKLVISYIGYNPITVDLDIKENASSVD